MSMLAEPRRKKAWILNPRKSQWAEDESKFGQKMLEKMGWSKGRGLGREMGGITEHIRPSVQNDSRGLGYEGRTDDWVAHLDDFNDLLANLQQETKDTDREGAAKTNVKSLEERSKKSRARVHYHKFTRGKDLSRYSSQDLASILGGRSEGGAASQPVTPVSSRPPSPPPHADSEPTSEAETEQKPPTAEVDSSSGYTTINTGLSVKEYFAAKMRKMNLLKIKHDQEQYTSSSGDQPPDGESPAGTAHHPEHTTGYAELEEVKSKKKKKKKRAASPVDQPSPSVPEEENTASEEPMKKKKRHASPTAEVLQSVPEEENTISEEPKKKKKKRRIAENNPEGETSANGSPEETTENVIPAEGIFPPADSSEQEPSGETSEAPNKKKKKKKRKTAESIPEERTKVADGDGCLESRMLSARTEKDSIPEVDANELPTSHESGEAPKKKKKKRKNAESSPVETANVDGNPEIPTEDVSPVKDCNRAADASEQVPSDEGREALDKEKKKRRKSNKSKPIGVGALAHLLKTRRP